jgi:hypothetical protein
MHRISGYPVPVIKTPDIREGPDIWPDTWLDNYIFGKIAIIN